VEGLDVVTTLDLHLQDVATDALERQLRAHNAAWGTVILCEVSTGAIRAIANLSRVEREDGVAYWESYNHAIGTAVEPGSTFKLASLIACMEAGMSPNDSIDTGDGEVFFHGNRMRDSNHNEGGHGILSLKEIFEVSSNVGTALAVKQQFGDNPQAFLDGLQHLGVHKKTGIRFVGEGDPEVKTSVSDKGWTGLSLTQMAIGYEVEQTPLQTLTLYNAIANGGKVLRPQLVEALKSNGEIVKTYDPFVISPQLCSASTLSEAVSPHLVCRTRGRPHPRLLSQQPLSAREATEPTARRAVG